MALAMLGIVRTRPVGAAPPPNPPPPPLPVLCGPKGQQIARLLEKRTPCCDKYISTLDPH